MRPPFIIIFVNIIMKLSTIYILKHKFPLHLVYIISSYEETKYKQVHSDLSDIVELDEYTYIYPMQYTLYALFNLLNEIHEQHIFNNYWNNNILIKIISIINFTNDVLYDSLYTIDSILYIKYSDNMLYTSRQQIYKTINNIYKLSGTLLWE